jgi:hypothetical protein
MTIWLNAHLSPAIAVWITATFGEIHQRSSDRRYFSIILGIVPQLRYNYKLCGLISRWRRYGKVVCEQQSVRLKLLRRAD